MLFVCVRQSVRQSHRCSSAAHLRAIYDSTKAAINAAPAAKAINPKAVFANNELDLAKVEAYGFDYDYTLAVYKKELNRLIYTLTMDRLIKDCKYPPELRYLKYDAKFAVRGLHFDLSNSILLKLDTFCQIMKGTAYRGKRPVPDDQLLAIYRGLRVPDEFVRVDKDASKCRMRQLNDLFSLPEIGLLATVTEYFEQQNIDYDARSLYDDVQSAVNKVHLTGQMYEAVTSDIDTYVHTNPGLGTFIERLNKDSKTVFLITNSPYAFMDAGMRHLLGEGWRDLFDFVVVQAGKPRFFQDTSMPFRRYNVCDQRVSYMSVSQFERGCIYAGGNLMAFSRKAGLSDASVLYFGDHIHSDLTDPMLHLGWRTGAIVPELGREIRIHNSEEFQYWIRWISALCSLVEETQDDARHDLEADRVIGEWREEIENIKESMKSRINQQFGSIFRTHHNPSYFCGRLMRLADIYTSRLPNLLNYSLQHTFQPRRTPLPHEAMYYVPDIKLQSLKSGHL